MPSHAIVFDDSQKSLPILRNLLNIYSRLDSSHPEIFIASNNAWESLADSIQLYIDWLEIPSTARGNIPSMVSQKINKTLIDNIFIKISSIMETSWREVVLQSLSLALPEISDIENFVNSRIGETAKNIDKDPFGKLQKQMATNLDEFLPYGSNPKYGKLKDSLKKCSPGFWNVFESKFSIHFKSKILDIIVQYRNDVAHDDVSRSIPDIMLPIAVWYGFEISRILVFVYENESNPDVDFNYIVHFAGDYYQDFINNIMMD